MNTTAEKLLPDNKYWYYFLKICSIPHPSGHEDALRGYLAEEAAKHNLFCRVDKAGNLAIDRPAAAGFENSPVVILQAHLDMVPQQAPGVEFDFLCDPIPVQLEGDWVTTGGKTTLGADDGMGVALAMELLTAPDLQCGALRGVFTVSEETGLGGAEDIAPEFLQADILFNLDSDVTFTIGCAGGSRFTAQAELECRAADKSHKAVTLKLKNMLGGHSGVDIHRNVGSAAVVTGKLLAEISRSGFALSSVLSGTLANAIAREAVVCGTVPPEHYAEIAAVIERYNKELNAELETAPDTPVTLTMESSASVPDRVLTPEAQADLLAVWNLLPHGVLEKECDGSTGTSSNLGVVSGSSGSAWQFTLLVRSLYDDRRNAVTAEALELLHKYGFAGAVDSAYTSWEPSRESELLEFACKVYKDVLGKDPERFVVHGGLEPGIFCGMNPDLQMLSFAPATCAVHSPQEKLSITDSENIRKLLRALLEGLRKALFPIRVGT